MTTQITIIGLGQIGASIGLALSEYENLLIVGHDINMTTAKSAQKMGAIHKANRNLPSSVQDADIIILSLPLSEIYETLGYIKEDLKEGVLILDTAPSKVTINTWMQELLPAGREYIGLAPAINPIYLTETETGLNAAQADLFHKANTMIAAPPFASGKALQLASDLVQLIGSQPLYADIAELDGIMTTAHILPQLVSVALLDTTVDAPGWGDAKKITGGAYAKTTAANPKEEGGASLSDAAIHNSQSTIFALDRMIASLQKIKESVMAGDAEALNELFSRTKDERENWLHERNVAEWLLRGGKIDPVELGGISERFFGFKQRKPRK